MRSRRALAVLTVVLVLGAVAAHAAEKGKDKDEDNPHEKMVRSKGVCIECHTKVPKPGEHAADYFLVDAPSENCLGCHDESEHAGTHEHLGQELEKDADPAAARLPLDEHGKMACFTCHDPHPAGLIEGRTVHKAAMNAETRAFVAARPLPAKVERLEPSEAFGALLRIPVADGEGCRQCHVAKEEEAWRENLLPGHFMRVLPHY